VIVQIYAFTQIEQALQAAGMGVHHIGFVAGKYGRVHGELSFEQAAAMVQALPSHVKTSALTMATDLDEIASMAQQVMPDFVHISTDDWAVPPQALAQLRSSIPSSMRLMKAIAIEGPESLQTARAFYETADILLLDSKVSDLPGVGATGQTHDWSVSRSIVEDCPLPVILAGGLTPENVGQAIAQVGPAGVDSNTGTNLAADPVAKDMDKVAAFAGAVQDVAGADQ
jgi:phosphoribosylanthranilate isomerase